MHSIQVASVRQWGHAGRYHYPRSISAICPHCGDKVTISLGDAAIPPPDMAAHSHGRCPACEKHVAVIACGLVVAQPGTRPSCGEILLHPDGFDGRSAIDGVNHLPGGLQDMYQDAIAVYNAKVWGATAGQCRKALEALCADKVPAARGDLFHKLRILVEEPKLFEPLKQLTTLLREGGNLGAHFDSQRKPTKELADAVLKMTEYFLEYVYTLPHMIAELEAQVKALPAPGDQPPADTKNSHD